MKAHEWDNLFDENIGRYRRARPKRGQFLEEFLQGKGIRPESILEMGAFSGKDIRYLSQRFGSAFCCSLDKERAVFDAAAVVATSCVAADAFRMPFRDRAFDLTFHSGLIVVFDDAQSAKIVQEQVRVTSKYAVVFAHNRWNVLDVAVSALKRTRGDSLFRYRRFTKGLLRNMAPDGTEVVALGYVDNMLVNLAHRRAPRLAGVASWLGRQFNALLCNEVVMVLRVV
ncbi:hypothetical protein ABIE09_002779 [Lysobacter enzymogenes]|uniref:class I SAM-dependent methyltransferase n=1 Tax=Lysobacter enzymogenes TaxID=69 RepID=UPI003398F180